MPYADYRVVDRMNVSRLKELLRSPLHYRYGLDHPKQSDALTLGTAAHCATLEPERFASQFAIWDSRTEAGAMSPRRGKAWESFCSAHAGREVITQDQGALAQQIARAVRADPIACEYLTAGEPEVVMEWHMGGRDCKGRVDWLTTYDGKPCLVGLKSARDCRPFQFGAAAAKLGYALQWAWYHDGYVALKAGTSPRMVEIVVESAPPHAVVVYRIPDDVLEYGRDEYMRLLKELDVLEERDTWPGPATEEQILSLPTWVYGSDDDISDLELQQ
jgi:hypothetical protein